MLPYYKDYFGKRADRFGGKEQLRENTLSHSGRKRRPENRGIVVRTRPETDELAAIAGGLDLFQALWYRDEEALDALLRSGADTQVVCEDNDMTDFKENPRWDAL